MKKKKKKRDIEEEEEEEEEKRYRRRRRGIRRRRRRRRKEKKKGGIEEEEEESEEEGEEGPVIAPDRNEGGRRLEGKGCEGMLLQRQTSGMEAMTMMCRSYATTHRGELQEQRLALSAPSVCGGCSEGGCVECAIPFIPLQSCPADVAP